MEGLTSQPVRDRGSCLGEVSTSGGTIQESRFPPAMDEWGWCSVLDVLCEAPTYTVSWCGVSRREGDFFACMRQ